MINNVPLAARLRPKKLSDFVGQQFLLAKGKPIWAMLHSKQVYSMILWGASGTGKTTLARMIALYLDLAFEQLSAVTASIKDIREVVSRAHARKLHNEDTILFVDEVHRFNKAQQDAFLPYIEDGTLIFIGATTENPSFELNYALLSRVKVFILERLNSDDLDNIISRALADQVNGYNNSIVLEPDARQLLINLSDGDARKLLNRLEWCASICEAQSTNTITTTHIELMLNGEQRRFDNKGDVFYEQISALHKSIRGSDPDASLYWFCRMLDGGCDPLYIARRLTRIASEDIGNADPRAISICLDAWEVQKKLGSPEGELALAQAVVYLSVAAKSNAVYNAFNKAYKSAVANASLEVPKHLRNAPTGFMKNLNYGKDYRYVHNEENAFAAGVNYFPELMQPELYYEPPERGLEIQIKKKLEYLRELNKNKQKEII